VLQWARSQKETLRLEEAGLNSHVIDAAISAFVYEIIVRHGDPAPRLCNKDPFTLKSAEYLMNLFPNSKFIFMIRDPRATVHSIISRKVIDRLASFFFSLSFFLYFCTLFMFMPWSLGLWI
jgi:protein-tyrosine sulfotransferase